MIIDSSAIMAMILDEPERQSFVNALAAADRCAMSAATWVELAAVITRRPGEDHSAKLANVVSSARIVILPVTVLQAELGAAAYREYGRGTGHAAYLNFGDCFAYALSKETGEPLLFKGDDFSKTDVVSALA